MRGQNTAITEPNIDAPFEPLVGVVIVNYNSADFVTSCLKSLEHSRFQNFFVVVVDNCSPDGSGVELQKRLSNKRVTVILNPENGGFAAGNNIGIRRALASGADYVWLLNADTITHKDSLSSLVESTVQYPDTAVFGSKVIFEQNVAGPSDSTARIWSAGATIDSRNQTVNMRGYGESDRGQFEESVRCDYIPGCSLFARAAVFDDVAYLPEDYFMYFEETDWCKRVTKSGRELRYVPNSVVEHRVSDDKMQSPFTVYYYNKSEKLFWFRHGSLLRKARIVLKTLFQDLPRARAAYRAAPDAHHQAIFSAAVDSSRDFLLARRGYSNRN